MIFPIYGARLPKEGTVLDYLYLRTPTHKHRGIDFPAPIGTPVLAVESGIVEHAITRYTVGFRGYGRCVVIKGDSGRWFLYGHLSRIECYKGQRVLKGETIGKVGNSMFTKYDPTLERGEPHLHFEVSSTPYPMSSEAKRLNPRTALSEIEPFHVHSDRPSKPSAPPPRTIPRPTTTQTVIGVGIVVATLLWMLLKRL